MIGRHRAPAVPTPLTAEQRIDRYRRQTGQPGPTPRPRRRIGHKAMRQAKRGQP